MKLATVVVLTLVKAMSAFPEGLSERLQAIAKMEAEKYNCSISIAVRSSDDLVVVADGITDFKAKTKAKVTDKYVWGSCTKMHTAASIMNLVSKGYLSLDDKVSSLVDDVLKKLKEIHPEQNFSTLEDIWGERITHVTIRQLLSMTDGVPDFDTATPQPGRQPVDPLRAKLYETPDHFDGPTELMSVPWVRDRWTNCNSRFHIPPGFCYSSTNYILLGLVLAHFAQVSDWTDLDQTKTLPTYLQNEIAFARDGTPVSLGAVHGYDRTSYNMPKGVHNDHDNGQVKGVFAGWTASNLVTSASAMANMTWEIYAAHSFAPKHFIDQMLPPKATVRHPLVFYGLGTFTLNMVTGQRGDYGVGYGHLGATYGYQSLSGYFPALNITLAVGTNIETDDQVQPADTTCLAYNAVAGAMLNMNISCTFEERGYYGGTCKCTQIESSSIEKRIEQLVCKVAEKRWIHDKAIGAICDKITAVLPNAPCEAVLERIWQKIKDMCPDGRNTTAHESGALIV
mmetsp:Transcript_112484/g.216681  ORF Transcript_112484/g.216681 Transcript_112484/m.216681 type:complete len:510 (-) Transcript_112484:71-1600(-)